MRVQSRKLLQALSVMTIGLFLGLPGKVAGQVQPTAERLASFEMEWAKRSSAEATRRAGALAQVMIGREVSAEGVEKTILATTANGWKRAFVEAPEVYLRYIPRYDEIRLLDLEIASVTDPPKDIGEREALALAGKYLEELGKRRLVESKNYDIKRAQVGYGQVAGGPVRGEKAYERTTEYRVTLRPALNGIEVANAGVRLSIHASGRLAAIRIGGLTVNSKQEGAFDAPVGEGKLLRRRVSDSEIDRRFQKSLPAEVTPKVAWSRVMYVMPEDTEKAVVEPLRVYSYSEVYKVDGQLVPSRRKVVGYSLTDPDRPPVDFTAAKRVEQDQEPKRPSYP